MVVCLRCLLHHVQLIIAYTFRENREFVLEDRIRLFVHFTISLSSSCKLIWRHWTFKMPARYSVFVECVSKIGHILSVIHYKIRGAVCFQLTHFPCDDWDNIYTLPYYHHQIGSMTYYQLFRVRSWNNGMRCMSFCILIIICVTLRFVLTIHICLCEGTSTTAHASLPVVSMTINVEYDFIDDATRVLLSLLPVLPKVLLMFKMASFIFYNGFTLFIFFTVLLTDICALHNTCMILWIALSEMTK